MANERLDCKFRSHSLSHSGITTFGGVTPLLQSSQKKKQYQLQCFRHEESILALRYVPYKLRDVMFPSTK